MPMDREVMQSLNFGIQPFVQVGEEEKQTFFDRLAKDEEKAQQQAARKAKKKNKLGTSINLLDENIMNSSNSSSSSSSSFLASDGLGVVSNRIEWMLISDVETDTTDDEKVEEERMRQAGVAKEDYKNWKKKEEKLIKKM